MKLKLPLLVGFLLCLSLSINAQKSNSRLYKQPAPIVNYNQNVKSPLTSVERQQLQEVYGDKLQDYVLSKPERLTAIKNILRNRVSVVQITDSKNQKSVPLLSEVSLFNYYVSDLKRDQIFNKNTFNPLKYNFNFYSRAPEVYKVDNTNYYIIIKSQHN